MTFKAKLRRIGNSLGVLIPRNVITDYKEGDEIELQVITKQDNKVITEPVKRQEVITPDFTEKSFNTTWCSKHSVMKGTCGCK